MVRINEINIFGYGRLVTLNMEPLQEREMQKN